jgi:hypothetical protein
LPFIKGFTMNCNCSFTIISKSVENLFEKIFFFRRSPELETIQTFDLAPFGKGFLSGTVLFGHGGWVKALEITPL